jgi:hypothetical protein|tara:strand:+ start:3234 stop:4085 length:852 start_codon:yes stop_codon:yes gene_type:complete
MAVKFSNNASTTLAGNASSSATSISVADGSVFPALSASDYFYLTLETAANTAREIVKCTARNSNALTIVRAQDSTSAIAFVSGDKVELRLTAAIMNDLATASADLSLSSFTGDGSTITYALTTSPIEANTLVYLDGVYQNKTAYSIVDNLLTFSAPPASGVEIEITAATVAPVQASSEFRITQLSGDGSTTVFTLSSQATENNTNIFIDGVYQSKSNYSVSGTTLTMSSAPPSGVSIEVMSAHDVIVSTTTPADNSVTNAKLDSVLAGRISDLEDEILLNLGV